MICYSSSWCWIKSKPVLFIKLGIEGLEVMYLGDLRADLEVDLSICLLGVGSLPLAEIKASVWLNCLELTR